MTTPTIDSTGDRRRKAVWGCKRIVWLAVLAALSVAPSAGAASRHGRPGPKAKPGRPSAQVKDYKLDEEVTRRATRGNASERTRVIVTLVPGASLPPEFKGFAKSRLDIVNGHVLELTNGQLKRLAAHTDVFRVHFDRPTQTHNYRTSVTVGAAAVRQTLGYTGAGVGVAVIDSGISTWHDDLTPGASTATYPYGQQRVAKFVDFVNGQALPYDDNGHGTHVAGTIAGNGYDSSGEKAGIAPGAALVSLKVLDAHGQGTISGIIAALDWVVKNGATYKIRVVNLSVGANIHESYWTDPLTLATKRVVDQGIVVVAAAGNMGKNAAGQAQWGAITAPGNAPWVLTVGASSTMGTLTRTDDTMASYSSRGPTFIDYGAKPDLVAPGTGTVSLAVPGSTFYTTKAPYLLKGTRALGTFPYLTLSGTSMAAPVVSGSVALMLQANPKLTPNLVKAILQYTAERRPGYKALEEGTGFLNTLGAVRLAQFFKTAKPGDSMPVQKVWSRRILWGNHLLKGGYITPSGNAWATNIVWGAANTSTGDNIVWGSMCDAGCDNIVWGSNDGGSNIVWGSNFDPNIVWGSSGTGDNIVWGSMSGDDNIVWGSDCGGADCDNIVWGSASVDNIVWGSASDGDNIVWGSSLDPNIVWGASAGEDVTWGSSADGDTAVFDDTATEPLPDVALEFGDPGGTSTTIATVGGL
jgi:serine protease AprX